MYTYQELIDRHGGNPQLWNGLATGLLQQGKAEQAEAVLQESLDRDTNGAETLVNMLVLCHRLARPPEVSLCVLSILLNSAFCLLPSAPANERILMLPRVTVRPRSTHPLSVNHDRFTKYLFQALMISLEAPHSICFRKDQASFLLLIYIYYIINDRVIFLICIRIIIRSHAIDTH